MGSSELSQFQNFSVVKYGGRSKLVNFLSDSFLYVSTMMLAFLVIGAFWSVWNPNAGSPVGFSENDSAASITAPLVSCGDGGSGQDLRRDPPEETFYDDPTLTYTIDTPPIQNWDEKRTEWLKLHPSFSAANRIVMVTGSMATPCKNPTGDHLLLKLFKNKVDYCRRHNIDIFYNNVLLQPKMYSFWAKTPTIKAVMLAHPEAEWIWWVDSDAAITDMDFNLPLQRYSNHNFVLHGWPSMIYEKKSWTSVNAGVFLIRNCQWSMDFMDVWSSMGPQSDNYEKWGETLSSLFKDKIFPESDDQSGLVYLLLNEKQKWGDKIYIESEYYFEGYWLEIVGTLENITEKYNEMEKQTPILRRRHAEKVTEYYGTVWEEYLKEAGYGRGSLRRPFITHFTGCQPCSGEHNEMYPGQTCFEAIDKALLFADNQVLKNYGFIHPNLKDPSQVNPLPFESPV